MREILFRGKEARQGKWIEGFFCPCVVNAFPATPCIIEKKRMDNGIWEPAKIVPETVGQFTGLLDANGKKIFEGDIIEIYGGYFIVRFENSRGGWFPFASGDGCGCCEVETYEPSSDGTVGFDVIGNIHDNPELVEVSR